jgi:CheY-like chemotaxis protein
MIVDYIMPGMTGKEVAAAALDVRPDLPILFATGYAETTTLEGELAAIPVLRKPFTMAGLSELVSGLLRQGDQSVVATATAR